MSLASTRKFSFSAILRDHHFLAGGGKPFRDVQIILQAQQVAARTDGFAEVDDVHGRVSHLIVKTEHGVAIPIVEDRAES